MGTIGKDLSLQYAQNATAIWVGIILISTYPSFAEKRAIKLELNRKRVRTASLNFSMSRTASPNGNTLAQQDSWLQAKTLLRLMRLVSSQQQWQHGIRVGFTRSEVSLLSAMAQYQMN